MHKNAQKRTKTHKKRAFLYKNVQTSTFWRQWALTVHSLRTHSPTATAATAMSWFWNTKSTAVAAPMTVPPGTNGLVVPGYVPVPHLAPNYGLPITVDPEAQRVAEARAVARRQQEEATAALRRVDMLEINNATHKVQKVPRKDVQTALQQLVKTIDAVTYAQKEAEEEQRNGAVSKEQLAAMKARFDAHLDKMCEVITLLHPEQTEEFAATLARKRRFDAQQAAQDAVSDQEWVESHAATEVMPAAAAAAADNKRQRQCKSAVSNSEHCAMRHASHCGGSLRCCRC